MCELEGRKCECIVFRIIVNIRLMLLLLGGLPIVITAILLGKCQAIAVTIK